MMFSVQDLQAHKAQGEAIDDFLSGFGRRYREAEGKPLDNRAKYIDSWEIYADHISLYYSYYVCGCCGPETEYVSIPLADLINENFEAAAKARAELKQREEDATEEAAFEAKMRSII